MPISGEEYKQSAGIRARAESGDANSQLALAHLIFIGKEPALSREEPAQLLDAACEGGVAEAYLLKAALLVRGVGYAENLEEAYVCVQRAASRGSAHARAQLNLLGSEGVAPWLSPISFERVADEPRISMVQHFIPPVFCPWLIQRASPRLGPAPIVRASGGMHQDPTRNNSVAAFAPTEGDLIVQLVCRRIAMATGTALANHEPPNILRYAPGQRYLAHYDFIPPWQPEADTHRSDLAQLGQRVATVLIYLNHAYEGGETAFPRLGLKIKGGDGAALIFWNLSAQGEPERNSLHAGLEVTKGEKWLLSQWIREKPQPLL